MAAKGARKWGLCGYTFHLRTYRVPSGTSRAKSEVIFPDLFRRKLRDGRSWKDGAKRGRHHAIGTRYIQLYVGELFGRPVGSISCHSD